MLGPEGLWRIADPPAPPSRRSAAGIWMRFCEGQRQISDAVDHEGEILEAVVTAGRDTSAIARSAEADGSARRRGRPPENNAYLPGCTGRRPRVVRATPVARLYGEGLGPFSPLPGDLPI
jgi:hypothetical protein